MLDTILYGGGNMGVNVGEAQSSSPTMPAVARQNVGLIVQNKAVVGGELGGDFHGRLSAGILELAVVGLVIMYLWTRNVQGGG